MAAFQTGYISPNPVRLLGEYDDVSANVTSATLVRGTNRVQNVPITAVDPNQPPGSIPGRGAGQAPAQGATATGTPMDKAQQGVDNVNNQINTVNDQKKKAKSLWEQLKGAAQNPKQ